MRLILSCVFCLFSMASSETVFNGELTAAPTLVSSTTLDRSLNLLKEVGPLMGDYHGVKGVVYIVDPKTIKIVGFAYDGLGPDAFFYVGRTLPVEETGILVPYPGSSTSEKLLAHDGSTDIILTLPGDLKTTEIKWLSVWCPQFAVSFGDVKFLEIGVTTEDCSPFSDYEECIMEWTKCGEAKSFVDQYYELFYDATRRSELAKLYSETESVMTLYDIGSEDENLVDPTYGSETKYVGASKIMGVMDKLERILNWRTSGQRHTGMLNKSVYCQTLLDGRILIHVFDNTEVRTFILKPLVKYGCHGVLADKEGSCFIQYDTIIGTNEEKLPINSE